MVKKLVLVIITIIVTAILIIGLVYWYSQNQAEEALPMRQVALDKPEIDSFDNICTDTDDGNMICKGNIEVFGCTRYADVGNYFFHLSPTYPIGRCEKDVSFQDAQVNAEGIYRRFQGFGLGSRGNVIIDDYVVIKDGTFQLIQSSGQLSDLYQPIQDIAEAEDFFKINSKGILIQKQEQLDAIKQRMEKSGTLYIPTTDLTLSTVSVTDGGFTINAYSDPTLTCVEKFYSHIFFLATNGSFTEKNNTLVWESSTKPACLN